MGSTMSKHNKNTYFHPKPTRIWSPNDVPSHLQDTKHHLAMAFTSFTFNIATARHRLAMAFPVSKYNLTIARHHLAIIFKMYILTCVQKNQKKSSKKNANREGFRGHRV